MRNSGYTIITGMSLRLSVIARSTSNSRSCTDSEENTILSAGYADTDSIRTALHSEPCYARARIM